MRLEKLIEEIRRVANDRIVNLFALYGYIEKGILRSPLELILERH